MPPGNGGTQRIIPEWLHRGPASADISHVYDAWRDCIRDQGSGEDIFLHPDLALAPRSIHQDAPIVYTDWTLLQDRPRLQALAVLPKRTLSIAALPGRLGVLRICGRRLMGNRLLGGDTSYTQERFADTLHQLLADSRMPCLVVQDVESGSPLCRTLLRLGDRPDVTLYEPAPVSPHRWIRFPDKADHYWQQFTKKTRYNFRYRAKHLDHSVLCVRKPEDIPMFLERAEQVAHRTWQYRKLGYGPSATPLEIAFYQRVAALGAFRSYLLEQQGRPVAFAIGIQWNGTFVYEQTGFDPDLAPKSPGQVLLYRVIEDLIHHDTPRFFDFGYGDSDYKQIFANHHTLSGPLVIARRDWRPRIAMTVERTRRAIGQTARAALRHVGLLSPLRRFSRHRSGAKQFFTISYLLSAVCCAA